MSACATHLCWKMPEKGRPVEVVVREVVEWITLIITLLGSIVFPFTYEKQHHDALVLHSKTWQAHHPPIAVIKTTSSNHLFVQLLMRISLVSIHLHFYDLDWSKCAESFNCSTACIIMTHSYQHPNFSSIFSSPYVFYTSISQCMISTCTPTTFGTSMDWKNSRVH